ncbi:MAG: GAF domain-containing protein, partial [Acidimicrobiales bacterium]
MIRVLDSVAGALNAGGAQVTSTGSIVQLASAATRSLATALGGSAVLWLLDDAEDLLGAVASADQDPALSSLLARGLARARPSSAPGLLGRVVSTGAPVEVPKAAWKQIGEWDDPEALAQLEASGPVALCIVPVRARSKVLGALLLGRRAERGAAIAAERTLLQDVADQIGLAAAHDVQVSARFAAE